MSHEIVSNKPRSSFVDRVKSAIVPSRVIPPVSISRGGQIVHHDPAVVSGTKDGLDSESLMRMIREITQQIGDYKRQNSLCGNRYVIPALRKARAAMVSDLESKFRIHWKIDNDGQCYFYR